MNKFTIMIKPNELRIGNLIKYTGTPYPFYPIKDGIVEVEEILGDGVNLSSGDSTLYNSELLEGILLTPEWLERCGFTYEASFYRNGRFMLTINTYRDGSGNYDGFYFRMHIEGKMTMVILRHLHQLQNLYFTMTGEELTIKEPA